MSRLSFKSNGTEGMLDVILGCTLIFMLLSALARKPDESSSGNSREVALPAIELSQFSSKGNGGDDNQALQVSLKMNGKNLQVFIDNEAMSLEQFKQKIKGMKTASHVNLRRDKSLACSYEDQVILACRDAGVYQVAIVLEAKN